MIWYYVDPYLKTIGTYEGDANGLPTERKAEIEHTRIVTAIDSFADAEATLIAWLRATPKERALLQYKV